jgi:hypothetical protein
MEIILSRFALRFVSLVVLAVALVPADAGAQTQALSYTSNNIDQGTPDTTRGWAFTASTSLLVTDLGIRDTNFSDFSPTGGADGLVDPHQVTIWTTAGVVVAQATVLAGTASPVLNGFRYAALAVAVALAPGNYIIGAFYRSNSDPWAANASGITLASGLTYGGVRSGNGDVFIPGDDATSKPATAIGPNFLFTNGSATVPEGGGTIWQMLIALSLLVYFGKGLGRSCAVR